MHAEHRRSRCKITDGSHFSRRYISSAFGAQVTCCSGEHLLWVCLERETHWMRRERRPKKPHTTPAGPQTFMSSSARVAPRRPVRFHCIMLSSVPASTVPMKLCLIGRIFSIIAAASIYQSVHRLVYSCKNAYILPPQKTVARSA